MHTLTMQLTKKTKNCDVYTPVPNDDGTPPPITNLYVQNWASMGSKIEVTLKSQS